jgi:ubiquitin carboxyl-terminal hydrolase 16/45
VHSGGLSGGHYIAYVRYGRWHPFTHEGRELSPPCGAQWMHVSDRTTSPATIADVLSCEAYLLFYERVRATS